MRDAAGRRECGARVKRGRRLCGCEARAAVVRLCDAGGACEAGVLCISPSWRVLRVYSAGGGCAAVRARVRGAGIIPVIPR